MAVKNIKKVPLHVPGEGMAEFVRRAPQWIKSDAVAYNGDTAVNLFEIPGNALVVQALVQVTTAYQDGSTSNAPAITITVPNDTGTETIFQADSDVNATLLQSTGFYAATGFALTPASGGYVILSQAPGTTTTGALQVYLEYVPIADRI